MAQCSPPFVLCPVCDQPLHMNKRHVDREDFLTLKDSTATVIESHDDDGTKDETVLGIEPESPVGHEFIHKTDENGYRAKTIEYFSDQKKRVTSLGDHAKEQKSD